MHPTTITTLFQKHGIIHSDVLSWRITHRVAGSVNGLPDSLGVLVATNGILCYLENVHGQLIGPYHVQWFEPIDEEGWEVAGFSRKKKPQLSAEQICYELLG